MAAAIGPGVQLADASASIQELLARPRGSVLPGPGATTGGGPGDVGVRLLGGSEGWTRWWSFNRESFLAEIREQGSGAVRAMPLQGTRATGPLLGLSPRKVHGEVVPELQSQLAATKDVDLAVGCLLALGKIGEAPLALAKELELDRAATVERSIRARLHSPQERIREAALLALGLVGGPRAATSLIAIAAGLKEGNKVLDDGSIDERTRAFATYALGLLGHHTHRLSERRQVVTHLMRLAEQHLGRTELATAAVIGLGWAPLPLEPVDPSQERAAGGQEETIRRLFALFRNADCDLRTRAQIPVAMARLIRGEVHFHGAQLPPKVAARREELRVEFLSTFTDRLSQRGGEKTSSAREGLTQALGLLADPGAHHADLGAIQRLIEVARTGQEREGGLAQVALARIAARAGKDREGPHVDAAHIAVTALMELSENGNSGQRPWASLALGLFEHRSMALGAPPSLRIRARLRQKLSGAVSSEGESAASIAVGLARDSEAVPKLIKGLATGDYSVRGLHATALALLGAGAAVAPLREIAQDSLVPPILLEEASVALALLRDEQLVGLLVGKLARSRFMPERIAALQGLAWCHDAGAVPALLYVLREKRIGKRKVDDTSRAFAAAALGRVCSKHALPWNTHLALDVTWNAAPPSLTDVRNGGGVLDLF